MTDYKQLSSTQTLLSHLLGKPWRDGEATPPSKPPVIASEPQALPLADDEAPDTIETPLATATPAPLWRVVNSQDDLSPTELQLAKVMACHGFLAPATLARKSQLPLHQVKEALTSMASVGFVLHDDNTVALNVYAKQRLNLSPYPPPRETPPHEPPTQAQATSQP